MRALVPLLLLFPLRALAAGEDFERASIAVDLTGLDTTIEVELDVVAGDGTLDLLKPPLPITRLTMNGVPATASPHPQAPAWAVQIPYEAAPGAIVHLSLAIAGRLDCRTPGQPGAIRCLRSAGRTIFPPPSGELPWTPIDLYAVDPFDAKVSVKVPLGERAVLSGARTASVSMDGASSTYHFETVAPAEGFGLAAGALSREEAPGAAGYFFGAEPRRFGEAVELAGQLVPVYQRIYGPLPLDEVQIVSVPRGFSFGGLGLLGTLLMGEYVFDDYDYLLEQGTAHELAHSWWGNLASGGGEGAGFFGEAFAEYSAWRALGELRGAAARMAGMRMNAVWYLFGRPNGEDRAILDPDLGDSPVYVHVTYHKGAIVLRTLETRVGTEAFDRALSELLARGLGGLDPAALADALSRATGRGLGAEVDAWLRSTGAPELTVTSSAGRLFVDATAPAPFSLPVRLVGAAVEERVIEVGRARAELPLPERLVRVEIDPEWATLRTVRPATPGDVTFDGRVDAFDLLEIGLHQGGALPSARRVDGSYDPLYDLDEDRVIGPADLTRLRGLTTYSQ